MGTNNAVYFANVAFFNLKHTCTLSVPFFSCYIDDLLTLTTTAINPLPHLQQFYLSSSLNLISTHSDSSTKTCLDLQLSSPLTQLTYNMVQKPFFLSKYPHFHTYQPHFIKSGFIIGEAIRILNRNTSRSTALIQLNNFFNFLTQHRHYNLPWIIQRLKLYYHRSKPSIFGDSNASDFHLVLDFNEFLDLPKLLNHAHNLAPGNKIRIAQRQLPNSHLLFNRRHAKILKQQPTQEELELISQIIGDGL